MRPRWSAWWLTCAVGLRSSSPERLTLYAISSPRPVWERPSSSWAGTAPESFAHNTADNIRLKVQTILQMAAVLTYGASTPVVKVGRMAGQYAKPRSSDTETRGEVTLPAFRGDSVNGHEFTPEARIPDPARMLDAYLRSGTTLNLIRAFTMGRLRGPA